MAYSTTINALDLSSGVPDVRIAAGYVWDEVGGPKAVERRQDETTLDVSPIAFLSNSGVVFAYPVNLAPPPSPAWFIALSIQEIPRISNGTGWLFRSGPFTTDPPAEPLEVILAPEQFIGAAEISTAIGTLPIVSGTTTIQSLTLVVVGDGLSLEAHGSDANLPAGVTFNYTATLVLIPNGSLIDVSPFGIELTNPSLTFTAGTGTGFVTTLLNILAGVIYNNIAPRVKATIEGQLNEGVLSDVATRLNRGTPTSMPQGIVMSLRSLQGTTRATNTGSEPVIGVRAALGAFGGVLNKFPALVSGDGSHDRTCFVKAAMLNPLAPEVVALRAWRDQRLVHSRWGGRALVAAYERLSPSLARFISGSEHRRSVARWLIVTPAARLARWC